jgi:hypothetical protein
VTHERECPSVRAPITGQVDTEHFGLARVDRDQTGEQSKKRALPRTVATRYEDDLAFVDIEVHTGERREPVEEADDGAETDDGLHKASLECP